MNFHHAINPPEALRRMILEHLFTGCWNGFNSNHGTESVGTAANKAVVTASVAVIIIDAIIVQITSWIVYS